MSTEQEERFPEPGRRRFVMGALGATSVRYMGKVSCII